MYRRWSRQTSFTFSGIFRRRAAGEDLAIAAFRRVGDGVGFGGTPHPHAQDIEPAARLERLDRRRADHAAVGHDTDVAHLEVLLQSIHDVGAGFRSVHFGGFGGSTWHRTSCFGSARARQG